MNHRLDSPAGASAPIIFCRSCASPLVQAVDWTPREDASWEVRLWCPDCGFQQQGVLQRAQLVYLALAVEGGFAWLLKALTELDSIAYSPDQPDLVQKAKTERLAGPLQ